MNLISFVLFIFLSINAFAALTLDEERKYDELEGASFLKALILDKKYAEVQEQFHYLKIKAGEEGEVYYYLALSHFELKKFKEGRATLLKASKFKTPVDFYALWGRTEARLKDYSACREKFQKLKNEFIRGSDWEIYFSCLVKTNEEEALRLALNSKLNNADFFLESQGILLSNELLELGKTNRDHFLEKCQSVEFYLRLWRLLEKKKVSDLSVLERAHACHPKAMEITSQLVKALFNQGRYHSVAQLFETLSAEDETYLKHAAEFYKVAGRNNVADYFFGLGKEEDYLLHRSSYFLNHENYAGLLSIPLRPEVLGKNKDLSYALAYSYFKYFSLDESKAILGHVSEMNNRDKALINLIDQCRELDWRCRP